LRRQAKSSMPITLSGSAGTAARRLMTRRSVSRLTGSRRRPARLAAGQARGRPPAEREAEMVDDLLQPPRASCEGGPHVGAEALGEDLPPAQDGVAAEAPDDNAQFDASPAERKVGCTPSVVALNPPRARAAGGTGGRHGTRPNDHGDPVHTDVEVVDDEARRHEA
jgi:hypothetical protein